MYSKEDYLIEHETKDYYLIRLKENISLGSFKIDKNQLENE